jgi:hypothetical protein
MSTITTINGADAITDSRTVLNTNFANLNADKVETSVIDTDTALAANSDSKIPTQKAVKAYVDAGGNVNASETNKGIVEEATQAEVEAGTATGGTGARLFVNPSTLESSVRIAKVALSSSDILAGYVTPKELIPAPGAGKLIVVDDVVYDFTAGTQYVGGGDHQIRYASDSVNLVNAGPSAQRFTSATSFIQQVVSVSSGTGVSVILTAGTNKAVQWSNATASYTTGTGTANIHIKYRIITL